MSLKERMAEIREAERAQKEAREAEEKRIRKIEEEIREIRKENYKKGLPKAKEVQAELLEELRQVGIIPLIEEIAGRIPPLPVDGAVENDEVKGLWKRQNSFIANVLWGGQNGWVPFITPPEMGEDGWPKHTLRIEIKIPDMPLPSNMVPGCSIPIHFVSLEYNRDGMELTIEGKEKYTFRGFSAEHDLSLYEDALAHAFMKPGFRK
jgi:hypothetical protein